MTTTRHLDREGGFTLIELLVVMIIISCLFALAAIMFRSAQVTSRAQAMLAAGAQVDAGIATFNRIYPPVTTDMLTSKLRSNPWTGNSGNANKDLTTDTGEQIIRSWPQNPYTGTSGVRVLRYAAGSCPSTLQPGDIAVCRVSNAAGMKGRYRILAFAKNSSGATYAVYDKSH